MTDIRRDLARSDQFVLTHEWETAYLNGPGCVDLVVGHHYGDPAVGVIDPDEIWCCTGGYGLIVYYIKPPLDPYDYGRQTDQWFEVCRDQSDEFWVASLEIVSPRELRASGESHDGAPRTVTIDVVDRRDLS